MTAEATRRRQDVHHSLREHFHGVAETLKTLTWTPVGKAIQIGVLVAFGFAASLGVANTTFLYQTNPNDVSLDNSYLVKANRGQSVTPAEQTSHDIIQAEIDAITVPAVLLSELGGIGVGLLCYRRQKKEARDMEAKPIWT